MKNIERLAYYALVGSILLATLVPLLALDRWIAFVPFTISPRVGWIVLAGGLMLWGAYARRRKTALAMLLAVVIQVIISPLGLGGLSNPTPGPASLNILSFNTHNPTEDVAELVELCKTENADILCFQEISPADRHVFVAELSDYEFFAPDVESDFLYKEPSVFSCLIGFKKGLLVDPGAVRVFTAVTGYRTFAVEAALKQGPIHIVNVHSTKPVAIGYGLEFFLDNAIAKARRHRDERDQLEAWLRQHGELPVLVAGDFNATAESYSLRLQGFHFAQRAAGKGLHLTFPAKLPVLGIDHILGNDRIRFLDYRRIDTGISDHLAQVATFELE